MPELKSEVPGDEELRAYLAEWLDASSIRLLAGFPGDQDHYHPEVVEALAFLSSSPVRSRFLESATKTLFASLQRLNSLGRDDSFWENTNRRPTIYKLSGFGQRVLKDHPDDALSLLTRAILNVAFAGEFRLSLWVQLYRLNAVDLEYVTFAALMLEVAGAPTAEEFAQFLIQTGNAFRADLLLLPVQKGGGTLLGQWSRAVAAALQPSSADGSFR